MLKFNSSIQLYDCFKSWLGYNEIFLFADPHFGDNDDGQIDTDPNHFHRPISSEQIVKNINSQCHKKDLLIILGDVGDISYVRKLKAGYKVLIKGNHDAGDSNYKSKDKKDRLFDEVYPGILTINDDVIISHEPIDLTYLGRRFMLNIDGHIHNYLEFCRMAASYNQCITSDFTAFMPVRLSRILNSGVLHSLPSIHQITADERNKIKLEKEKEKNKND